MVCCHFWINYQKKLDFMVPNRRLISVLPYLGKISLDLRTKLRQSIERDLPYCKVKVVFRSKCRFNSISRFT